MTGLSDLVVLIIGKLYGKIQEHAPLPTVILALLIHRFFQKYEPQSPGICAFILFILPAVVSGVFKQDAPSILGPLLRTYAIFHTTLISSIILYRLSPFHPLARYTGPVTAKISKLWFVSVHDTRGWQGKQHVHYRTLHKKYGNVVRVGPNEIMVNDASAIVPLLSQGGWGKISYWAARSLHAPMASLDSIWDQAVHARRRRIWARGTNTAALKGYEDIISRRVVQLTRTLSARKSVDLARLFGCFSHDVMNDMVFGGGSEMLRDGDLAGHWALNNARMKMIALLGHLPWLAGFLTFVPAVVKEFNGSRQACFDRAIARREKGTKEKDLFYHLSDEIGAEKERVPFDIVASDADLAAFVGSGALKAVLSSLFYYLLCDQEKLNKLREEVDRFYPPGRSLSSKCFQEMCYLDACINETLRLSPSVPSGSQRDAGSNLDPAEGKTVGPYHLPEGTTVSIHPFTTHRDPRNFSPFTDKFWPERWLVAQGSMELPGSITKTDFVHNPAAFIPFSYGTTECVGKPLAMLVLRMATVGVLQCLDVRFEDGYARTWEDDWKDQFVLVTGELPVVLSRRK